MARRQLLPILRQSILVCRSSVNQYLLVQSQPNVFSLPLFHSVKGETFRMGLERGMSEMQINANLKGIVRIQSGRSGQDSFYRCIYYATATKTSNILNSTVAFKSYEQISQIDVSQLDRSLLKQIHTAEQMFSLDFFRERYVERGPMSSSRKIIVDV